MKLHGYIVIESFHYVPLSYYLCIFQFEALSWKKEVSWKFLFLAPLAVGQRAYVMVRYPLCVCPSVRPSVH